ncbi:hypothetical protein DsansV1_C21g0166031 [Dioscorea sansibarensis]
MGSCCTVCFATRVPTDPKENTGFALIEQEMISSDCAINDEMISQRVCFGSGK